MPNLESQLLLSRCPYCSVDRPNLICIWATNTKTYSGGNPRHWKIYKCSRCGGLVTASALSDNGVVGAFYPKQKEVEESIPQPANNYLRQALNSLHAPAGAVMLTASAVDAMLKAKGYKKGTLNSRIDEAAEEHLITQDMAEWAHEIRLDANEPRHANEGAPLPDEQRAKKCVDFALALAEFLFVLPSRVERGLKEATEEDETGKDDVVIE